MGPFGMAEDLISMALAAATSDPVFGSLSLTLVICCFNLTRFFLTRCHDQKAAVIGLANAVIGCVFAFELSIDMQASGHSKLRGVAFQLFLQMLVFPSFICLFLQSRPQTF